MRAVRSILMSVLLLSLGTVFTVSQAWACLTCDPFLRCVDSPLGARFCVMSSLSCSLLLQCASTPTRDADGPLGGGGDADLTSFTLFEAAPGRRPEPTLRSGAVPLAIGEESRAVAGVELGAIAEAGVAQGRDFAGAFVDEAGDGFALQRSVEGGQIRLEVREMRADRAGAVLASERMGEHDQLTVPVRFEGRDRVLVLSTRTVPKALARLDLSRLTRTIGVLGRAQAQRSQPVFKVHAL